MTDRVDVVVVGEALVDIVEAPGGRTEHPGGSPMNIAYGLGRLGNRVALLTRVGEDEHGRTVLAHLAAAGVELVPGSVVPGATSTALARLDREGAATYEFAIDWRLPGPVALPRAPLLHVGSIGATLEPGDDSVFELVQASGALVTFDPNVRPSIIGSREAALDRVERYYPLTQLVKLSDEDARWLYPDEPLEAIAQRLVEQGVRLVAITLGSDGCLITDTRRSIRLPAPPTRVADTIGAGDSFMSGLIDAAIRQGLIGAIASGRLSDRDLETLAVGGLASASVTVSRSGAESPDRTEVEAATWRILAG
ncbi:MAG: carbohydrate kinase [Actinobacteria bacterium]|nr:carbohydrate kinase [Actinomycetota bacterium]